MKNFTPLLCLAIIICCLSGCGNTESTKASVSEETSSSRESIFIRTDVSVITYEGNKNLYGMIQIGVDIKNTFDEDIYIDSDYIKTSPEYALKPNEISIHTILISPDDVNLTTDDSGNYVWSSDFDVLNLNNEVLGTYSLSAEISSEIIEKSRELIAKGAP